MKNKVNVTRSFLPPIEEYIQQIEQIWDNGQVTNQGPLLLEFEKKIEDYLGVENFHFVTNGTLALQIALKVLGITSGEVITTPFSYVATTSSILWERCTPVFVDIEENTLCIDADKIEAAITSATRAIMAVHVFGYPCNIRKIQEIADKHNLKVIYDAAHAFGAEYEGKSLLDYGDISICSFHATKLFHTIEGGGIVVRDKQISDKLELLKRFGHNGDDHYMPGTNVKASEFQAAMGLSNLKYVDSLISERQMLTQKYDELLGPKALTRNFTGNYSCNYAYYPVILESEQKLVEKVEQFQISNIFPRRYFYPALNTLPYLKCTQRCPIAEDVSGRILCLPLYNGLTIRDVERICEVFLND